MITISEKAVGKMQEMLAEQGHPNNSVFRVTFGGFGWGGPKLRLALDELNTKDESDVVVESQGIKIVFEKMIERYVTDAFIGYSTSPYRPGFYISGSSTC